MLHAQIYSTSSATYRSYSTGGVVHAPSATFRSTSTHVHRSHHKMYDTAPMQVANGAITTAASQLQRGKLVEEQNYIPALRERRNSTLPPPSVDDGGTEEYLPISETWDLWLFMAILAVGYLLWPKRRVAV